MPQFVLCHSTWSGSVLGFAHALHTLLPKRSTLSTRSTLSPNLLPLLVVVYSPHASRERTSTLGPCASLPPPPTPPSHIEGSNDLSDPPPSSSSSPSSSTTAEVSTRHRLAQTKHDSLRQYRKAQA
eukprot:651091-Rhodomonas_salina.1